MSEIVRFYHYCQFTKQFVEDTDAEYDPIMNELMIPANCTIVKPHKCKKLEINIFDEASNSWYVVPNLVGVQVYMKTNPENSFVWQEIGQIDNGFTTKKPKYSWYVWSEHDNKWICDTSALLSIKLKERQQLLYSTDWYVTRFIETGKPIPEAISKFRNKLRNIEFSKNWPNVKMPQLPVVNS